MLFIYTVYCFYFIFSIQARGLQLLDKIENHDIKGVEQILSRDTDLKVDRVRMVCYFFHANNNSYILVFRNCFYTNCYKLLQCNGGMSTLKLTVRCQCAF
jgi:hypothetical protein